MFVNKFGEFLLIKINQPLIALPIDQLDLDPCYDSNSDLENI